MGRIHKAHSPTLSEVPNPFSNIDLHARKYLNLQIHLEHRPFTEKGEHFYA